MTSLSTPNDHHRISHSAAASTLAWTRSLSPNGGLGGSSLGGSSLGGAGDAFADVFRMMANAESPAPPPTESRPPVKPADEPQDEETTEAVAETDEVEPEQENTPVAVPQVLNIEAPTEQTGEPKRLTEQTSTGKQENDSTSSTLAGSTADEPTAPSAARATGSTDPITEIPQPVGTTSSETVAIETVDVGATAKDAAVAATVASQEDINRRQVPRQNPEARPTAAENAPADKLTLASEGSAAPTDQATEPTARYAGDEQPASARAEHLRDRREGSHSRGERTAATATDEPAPQSARPADAEQRGQQLPQNVSAVRTSESLSGIDSSGPAVSAPATPTPTSTNHLVSAAVATANSSAPTNLQGAESGTATRNSEALTTANSSPNSSPAATSGSEKKSASLEGPRVADRAILVQRVSKAFQRLGLDGGQVRIRLHPEELGSVQLQMTIQGQRMSGRVVAETEAARTLLVEHLPELRQRLAEHGIQVERLDVSLEGEPDPRGQQNQSGTQQGGAGQGSGQQQSHPRWLRNASTANTPQSLLNESAVTSSDASGRSVIEAARYKNVDLIG